MRAPLTPIKAYVHDVQSAGSAGKDDATDDARLSHWLTVAQAAERLAKLPMHEQPAYVLALSQDVLPPRAGRPTQTEGDGREASEPIEQLAERLRLDAEDMERAGCFELALTTVSAVCRMLSIGRLSARLLATAHMGRVARQIGDLETAKDCYSTVVDEGKTSGDGPVTAHGYIGLGNVAHERGNRPAQKNNFQEALRLAPPGSSVEHSAHLGLMIVATHQRELADALLHGWRAHDLSPPDSEVQFSTLANLARTALEAGFHQAALSGFEFLIQRCTLARIRIPAIGGAMRAAAATENIRGVSRFAALGNSELNLGARPYDVARFHLWCATSWLSVGKQDYARASAIQARNLADQFGFHEVTVLADNLLVASPAVPPDVMAPKSPVANSSRRWNHVVRTGIDRLTALSTVS